jgi:hypothetical protein
VCETPNLVLFDVNITEVHSVDNLQLYDPSHLALAMEIMAAKFIDCVGSLAEQRNSTMQVILPGRVASGRGKYVLQLIGSAFHMETSLDDCQLSSFNCTYLPMSSSSHRLSIILIRLHEQSAFHR